ncbi:MAG: DUF2203 family protein [Deltaproteobacteria bacterium]|nr:DUF2203 family protein [Deltaproteobacteria bacterium]
MAEVFEWQRSRPFTLQEAQSLLPLVRRVTQEAIDHVEALKKRIEAVDPEPAHRPFYEHQLSRIVDRWSQKILKLGCTPKGLWAVHFDNGQGFYRWSYPCEDVEFFNTYPEVLKERAPTL